jgi:hypothetical protein
MFSGFRRCSAICRGKTMKVQAVAFLILALGAGTANAQMTQETRDFVLAEHNRLRQDAIGPGPPDFISDVTATRMLEMEYDMNLECVAQGHLDSLGSGPYSPNGDRNTDYVLCGGSGTVGENYFSGAPSGGPIGGATRAWVDWIIPSAMGGNDCSQRENFHGDRGCMGITQHYTQVLWDVSFRVGCGYTAAVGTVCNYSPAGNTGGSPFVVGEACSACPASHPYCANGLCTSVALIFLDGFE